MRIVSWNMAYWKPAGFKAVANRRRQWAYLMALAPDIALLQECRPEDFASLLPEWVQSEYALLAELPAGWTACTAVLARRSLRPHFVGWNDDTDLGEAEARWLGYLSGYVTRVELTWPDLGPLRVASVHAVAKPVDNVSVVTAAENEQLRRPDDTQAWHNDLAMGALRSWVGEHFVVGGDWNTARAFDIQYPNWGKCGQQFFERSDRWGWAETLRHTYAQETQTYLDPASYPYELDHVFTNPALHARLVRCKVIRASQLAEMSDHAPIVAEYR